MLPDRNLPWPIVWEAVVECANSEGLRLEAYRDVAGVWTIGWGETEGVKSGMRWTKEHADRQFCARLTEFCDGVQSQLTAPATANQLGALTSFAYNVGLAGFASSSVLKAHNRGDYLAASRAFSLWNKARIGGALQVVKGLTARRAREAALYLTPEIIPDINSLPPAEAARVIDMPEPVAESGMHQSPIAQSGAASIATGTLAAASAVSSDIAQISWGMGIRPLWIVAAVAIIVGAVVLYQRYKQRREGWA